MSIVTMLHKLETEFVEYAELAGKDIESVGEEVMAFLAAKKVEAQNALAANANPTQSGPAVALAGTSGPAAAATTANAGSTK